MSLGEFIYIPRVSFLPFPSRRTKFISKFTFLSSSKSNINGSHRFWCAAIRGVRMQFIQYALRMISSTRLSLRSFDSILSALVSLLFSSSQFRLCNFLDDISRTPRFYVPFLEFAPVMSYPNYIRRYTGTRSCSGVELVIWGDIWVPFYPE